MSAAKATIEAKHYDVILTSYGTLASELKKKVKWQHALKLNPALQKTKSFETPVLDDKARFHRIFLDEAQNIKNKATQAAAAACRVDAAAAPRCRAARWSATRSRRPYTTSSRAERTLS